MQHLQGDRSVVAQVAGEEHRRHPTTTQLAPDFVGGEGLLERAPKVRQWQYSMGRVAQLSARARHRPALAHGVGYIAFWTSRQVTSTTLLSFSACLNSALVSTS
jgi:hypothetical protein